MFDADRRRLVMSGLALAAARLAIAPRPAEAKGPSRQLTALGRAGEWLNTAPLTPRSLAGKIVLINFWTYTCINWLRTLPYLRAWEQRYRDGLVIVGVHTPEFGFEHSADNVRRAVREMNIAYPVVLDNDYAIWRAFDNQYWPALYLLDGSGRLRHHHFGEGGYDASEAAMLQLLAETGHPAVAGAGAPVIASGFDAPADWGNVKSPETYVGYERSERFASSSVAAPDRPRRYAAPARLALNEWALAGEWTIGRQATALNQAGGRIVFRFHARDLHLVMGPARPGLEAGFRVTLDGQPPALAHGLDIDGDGSGVVREQRLYQLIRQPQPIVDRQFAIEFLAPGVETFSFTFG